MEGLILIAILMVVGYFFGTRAETQHYRSLRQREQLTRSLTLSELGVKTLPPEADACQLVVGSVVISSDYFKTFIAGLLHLVGGQVTIYETLLDRARREAILRMQESALNWGAKQVINLRLETAELSSNSGNGVVSVEVVAYGTAIKGVR